MSTYSRVTERARVRNRNSSSQRYSRCIILSHSLPRLILIHIFILFFSWIRAARRNRQNLLGLSTNPKGAQTWLSAVPRQRTPAMPFVVCIGKWDLLRPSFEYPTVQTTSPSQTSGIASRGLPGMRNYPARSVTERDTVNFSGNDYKLSFFELSCFILDRFMHQRTLFDCFSMEVMHRVFEFHLALQLDAVVTVIKNFQSIISWTDEKKLKIYFVSG